MIPLSVMVTGKGTVSFQIKGSYGRRAPSKFTSTLKPIVFWNITSKCNLYCLHCYISAGPQGWSKELSRDEILDVANDIVELRLPLVTLTGGEPLLRDDFWDLAGRLVGGGVKVAVSTNGTLISEDTATRLAKLGVSYVGISLDSVNPQFHDMFRGVKGAFARALRGVESSLKAGVPVGLRMTLTRYNIGEAIPLLELARSIGVKRIAFYLIDMTGRAKGNPDLLPTREQLVEFVDSMIRVSEELNGDPEVLVVRGNFVGVHVADKLASSRDEFLEYIQMISAQGDCGRKTISIYPDGSVKPCQFIDWVDVGNVRERRLRDIISFENEKLKPYVEAYKHLEGSKCSKCPFKLVCGGGSRGRALALTGNPWGDDPLCYINPHEIAERWGVREEDLRGVLGN
jgi:radical SAM protein with 4Fe4S-binding SPASM domain